jgi:putative ABC transport system permease protein
MRSATPHYFETMGIRLVAGRGFTAADTADKPLIAVIGQSAARRLWPGADPIGGRVILSGGRTLEVVGVVADVKADRIEGEDWPTMYLPYSQLPSATMTVAVRTAGPPSAQTSAIVRAIHDLDPEQPVADVRPMENVLEESVAGSRFNTILFGVFAAVAFVLAAFGIYGVMAYEVSDRSHEMGIRIALGAQPGDVFRLILRQAAGLTAAGIVLGLGGAFALTRLMSSMLYGVKSSDALTFAVISLLLGLVAIAASYAPSRRAMILDPVATLRRE